MKADYKLIDYKENFYNILNYNESNSSDLNYKGHWHRSVEFSYCLSGSIVFNVNGIIKELKAGDFILINSFEEHFVLKKSENLKMMTIYISYNFLKQEFADIDDYNILLSDRESKEYKFVKKKLKEIFDVFADIDKDAFYKTKIKYLTLNILYELLKKCIYKKSYKEIDLKSYKNDLNCIKLVIEYVRNHYDEDISISEISKIAGLNPNYFCRYFREKTNYTFHQFLNRVRLSYAIDNLKNSNSTVLESSYIGGFPNVKSFITVCKSVYGRSPKQLINDFKNRISN